MRPIIFSLLCCLLQYSGIAQQKHALLIGIEEYYEVFGVRSAESLKGPVNDVHAMTDLLVKKFGVPKQNIDLLINGAATRDNIINRLKKKLNECRPGDQLIFYYSGHGVWMQNSDEDQKNDPVKQGMNQAMLTCDLYNFSSNFKCFIRDVTLKEYFNLFIDKKVAVTALMDCCFSGNLARVNPNERPENYSREKALDFNELMGRLTASAPDTRQLLDSIMGQTLITPPGCKMDAQGNITDKADSDKDGVPDCMDRQPQTPPGCLPVSADGIGLCEFEVGFQATLNRFDKNEIQEKEINTRGSFNGRQSISINEKDTVTRPADRKDSRFLFIAAATDRQKALEFLSPTDKLVHGMFTAAIMRVLEANPAETPVEVLFEKIKADMATFKKNQDPVMYGDPARMNMNLIGSKKK